MCGANLHDKDNISCLGGDIRDWGTKYLICLQKHSQQFARSLHDLTYLPIMFGEIKMSSDLLPSFIRILIGLARQEGQFCLGLSMREYPLFSP